MKYMLKYYDGPVIKYMKQSANRRSFSYLNSLQYFSNECHFYSLFFYSLLVLYIPLFFNRAASAL